MAYKIDYSYPCRGTNYTAGRGGNSVQYIVIHYTASQASARNNAIYFNRDKVAASAHYFVDGGGTIYGSVPENSTAWACGNYSYNQKSVSIEVVSDGRDFTEAEIQELTWMTQTLMKKYNVSASKVIRHYDCVGKYCPAPYVSNTKWATLRSRITTGATSGGTTSSSTSVAPAPAYNPSQALAVDGYLGSNTIKKLQSQLGTTTDGVISGQPSSNKQYLLRCVAGPWEFGGNSGSAAIRALQKKLGTEADGFFGKNSVIALQKFLGVNADGYLGEQTAKAFQTALNNNKFKGGITSSSTTAPAPSSAGTLGVDGYWGTSTTKALQKYLGTTADGIVSGQASSNKKYCPNCTTGWQWNGGGSMVIKALQSRLGVSADGYFGPNSIKALQRKFGVGQDGMCGPKTVTALQKALNNKTL